MTQLTLRKTTYNLPIAIAGSHAALELLITILPVLYPLLIAERGYSYAQIGTLALVAGLSGTLGQPIFGWLSDRWDARWIVLISIAFCAVAIGLTGVEMPFRWLIVTIGLAMTASAAYHPAGASLAAAVAHKRAGTVMSLFSTGGAAGSSLSPLLIGVLLAASGLTGTLLLIPLGLVLAMLLYIPIRQIELDESKAKSKAAPSQRGALLPMILLIVICGARSWLQGAIGTYLPEWISSQGASLEQASAVFSLFLIALTVGGFGSGFLADRIGNRRVIWIAISLLAPLYWLFFHSPQFISLIALAGLGLALGATYPTTILMAQRTWPRAVGVASSMVIGIGWMPASLGAWAVGRIADTQSLAIALNAQTFVPLIGIMGLVLYSRLFGDPAVQTAG